MDWINWIMELAGSFQQMSLSGARIDTQTLSQQALETEIWGGLRVLMISQMTSLALAGLILAGQIILGILLADLFSGVFHWWEDTYGDPEWPLIGPYVIQPNIWHHSEPLKFTRASFWKRNRVVFVLAILIGGLFWVVGWINPVTVTALIFGALANEVHVWSHVPKKKRPFWARALQDWHVFTTPKEHWKHHTQGFDKRYCTVTNALNPVLDGLRIFRIIEGCVEGLFGTRPRDEETGTAPVRRGRRALSRARRWVAARCWQVRRFLTHFMGPVMS